MPWLRDDGVKLCPSGKSWSDEMSRAEKDFWKMIFFVVLTVVVVGLAILAIVK